MVCNYFYFRLAGASICGLKQAHFCRELLQFATSPPPLPAPYLPEDLIVAVVRTGLSLFSNPHKQIAESTFAGISLLIQLCVSCLPCQGCL